MTPFYAFTLFLSALLLFAVQPMVGKMVLPLLGGSPAVWNTCMLFFQAMLLGGYVYAHASVALLGARRQAGLHLALLLLPLVALPIALPSGASPPTEGSPIGWLLWHLLLTAGLPFLVVSSTAPLLQKWFSQTGHPGADDPYFLYAASNLGSLLALLGYPLVIERVAGLSTQSRGWAGGYLLLVVMIAGCAAVLWRSGRASASVHAASKLARKLPASDVVVAREGSVGTRRRVFWLLLAAVPSSLMLGVTTHLTTNVAAMPLLWVIPLAVYLLTFVLAFMQKPLISAEAMGRLLPVVVVLMLPFFFMTLPGMEWRTLAGHIGLFFVAAMLCHSRLAADRPAPSHLTEYFLWISVGGVLGGFFNTIVAPLIFNEILEYPLMVAAAGLLLPPPDRAAADRRARLLDLVLPGALGLAALALVLGGRATPWKGTWTHLAVVLLLVLPVLLVFRRRPVRFGLAYGLTILVFATFTSLEEGRRLYVERNFFGRSRVVLGRGGQARMLYHGTTVHGIQRVEPELAHIPLSYYSPGGPIGDIFRLLGTPERTSRIGAVGLGAGAVASYLQPGQHITFYEIDPAVARIASDPHFFTFLRDCRGTWDIVLGDGRLTVARAADAQYGILLLDAYSSDGIPVHLLSREAMQLYLRKLAPGGVMVFHVSNRFMDLLPVVARLADDAGLACAARIQPETELTDADRVLGVSASHVAVVARAESDFEVLAGKPGWYGMQVDPARRVWTDQYADVVGLLLAHGFGG